MSAWRVVAKTNEIPGEGGRTFAVDGKLIAIFRVGEGYRAINDLCPHMGASLAEGYVENGAVTCPWHAWRFCLKDGLWLDSPKSSVRTDTYAVRVEGDELLIELPSAETETRADQPAEGRPDCGSGGVRSAESGPPVRSG